MRHINDLRSTAEVLKSSRVTRRRTVRALYIVTVSSPWRRMAYDMGIIELPAITRSALCIKGITKCKE